MPISNLSDAQIDQLIRMIPVVYEGTGNTIVPVLDKIRNHQPINDKEIERIETWGVVPAKGGGYKGDMCLAYIIRKWFKDHKLIK